MLLPFRRLLVALMLVLGHLFDRMLPPDWLQVFEEFQKFSLLKFYFCQLLSSQALCSEQGSHVTHDEGQLTLEEEGESG